LSAGGFENDAAQDDFLFAIGRANGIIRRLNAVLQDESSIQTQNAGDMTRHERKSHCWLLMLATGLGLFFSVPKEACGQEALRLSLAGEESAQAQKDAVASIGYYNLLLGHAALRVFSGLGVQYNDNIHLQNTNAAGDFIFTPSVSTQIHWPLSENNSLDISVGAGYSAYVNNPDLDQFFVNPGTGISFNIYVGDFAINLHERLAVTENGYQNAAATGSGNNATLQNTVGTSATWDLDKVVASAGYDHANYVSLGSGQASQPDGASENFNANSGVRVRPEILVGVEAGGTLVNYNQSSSTASPNTKQWNAGGFVRLQLSEYMSVQLDTGYTELLPEGTTTNLNTGNESGYYFDFSLTHRVNQFLDYTFTASRSTDLQSFGQPYSYYNVRWQPNWNLFRKFTVSTPFWWQQGTQLFTQAGNSNTYNQYGTGINIGRQITQKLSGMVSYQFIKETSNQSDLNYIVNIISLNLSYQF
jgi:hypothetical protein